MQRSSGLHLNKPQNLFLGIMHSTVFGDNQNTQHNSTNMSDQCAVRFVATMFFLNVAPLPKKTTKKQSDFFLQGTSKPTGIR